MDEAQNTQMAEQPYHRDLWHQTWIWNVWFIFRSLFYYIFIFKVAIILIMHEKLDIFD